MKPDRVSRRTPIYGNHDLARRFLQHIPEKAARFGAAVVVAGPHIPGGAAASGIGYPTDRTFLLGSVGKALNGLIYSGMAAGDAAPYE